MTLTVGIETEDLKLPILGDLRLLRNEVLKHRCVLSEQVQKRLEVIRGLEVGQVINFPEDEIEQSVRGIKAALDNMVQSATGTDPKFRTVWHVE